MRILLARSDKRAVGMGIVTSVHVFLEHFVSVIPKNDATGSWRGIDR